MSVRYVKRKFDWITLGIYFSLLIIGWLVIYAVTYSQNVDRDLLDPNVPITKQTIYLVFALAVFFLVQFINWKFWHTFAYVIYSLSLLLLLLVLVFGTEIKGARAWFVVGGFSFQPAEIAKLGTILALSSFLSYSKRSLQKTSFLLTALGIIFLPAVLILLQPDAGSAITFFSLFLLLFIEGLHEFYFLSALLLLAVFIATFLFPIPYVVLGLIVLAVCVVWYNTGKFKNKNLFFIAWLGLFVGACFYLAARELFVLSALSLFLGLIWLWRNREQRLALIIPAGLGILIGFSYLANFIFNGLEPHQQERIKVWLKPSECDPRGSLYNILQSKVAIGSGGILGKGYLKGNMTKLKFVPEQSTDFIFSSIGEEQGFVGGAVVIALFIILIWRLINHAENHTNKFVANFNIGVASFLLIHVLINIGMTMGIFPIIGIPLPFISKGGSALIGFSMMLGILIKMNSESK